MIDQFHDPGWGRMRHLLRSFPKAAAFLDSVQLPESNEKLAMTAFADPDNRLFPVNDKTAAVLSFLYAQDQHAPEPIMRDIRGALDAYSVPEDLFERVTVKVASLEPQECLFPETRSWPIRTREEVKTAESNLINQRDRLLPMARSEAFGRIYKRAMDLGLTPEPTTFRYVGMTETNAEMLSRDLEVRAEASIKTAAVSEKFSKLAEAVRSRPHELKTREVRTKLAAVIADLDREAGLGREYDHGIKDPVGTVFNTEKVATGKMLDLGNRSVSITKMAGLPSSFYGDALGDDFASELSSGGVISEQKLAEVIPTLPMDMKRNLSTALRGAGI